MPVNWVDGVTIVDAANLEIMEADTANALAVAQSKVSDAAYVHTQSALSNVWVVTHGLGKYPAVTVVDSGGSVIDPDIHFDSVNQLTISFGFATSGKAYLN